MVISFSEKESTRDLIPHAALVDSVDFYTGIEVTDNVHQVGLGYRAKVPIQMWNN